MNVSVIGGTGYVGLVTGIDLAAMGNRVVCADIDENKIENMNKGIFPIYEEGLEELLALAKKNGEIIFTKCIKTAIVQSDILIIAVGTPEGKYDGICMMYDTGSSSAEGYFQQYRPLQNNCSDISEQAPRVKLQGGNWRYLQFFFT